VSASDNALEITRVAAQAAADKKGERIIGLDVSEHMPLADVFLIASGTNERQVVAIAEAIEEALAPHGVTALRREGVREGRCGAESSTVGAGRGSASMARSGSRRAGACEVVFGRRC